MPKAKRSRGSKVEIRRGTIKRAALAAQIRRVGRDFYPRAQYAIHEIVNHIIDDALIYAEHARRKTITLFDVKSAVEKHGHRVYI